MKLFITNKNYFESNFTRQDYRDGFYKTPKEIHISAFNNLMESVSDNNIPIILVGDYKDDGWGMAIFEFKSKKDDIYFYEFLNTAS